MDRLALQAENVLSDGRDAVIARYGRQSRRRSMISRNGLSIIDTPYRLPFLDSLPIRKIMRPFRWPHWSFRVLLFRQPEKEAKRATETPRNQLQCQSA
jgi:hypothetical protein